MRLATAYAIIATTFVVFGFAALWWENRKWRGSGRRFIPAGTLIHINGIPVLLSERAIGTTSNWDLVRSAGRVEER